MEKVTRNVIAHRLADRVDFLTLAQARVAASALFDIVEEALRQRSVVEVRGFGTFRVKDYGPRLRLDPKSGERTQVPARSSVRFRSGSHLRGMMPGESGDAQDKIF